MKLMLKIAAPAVLGLLQLLAAPAQAQAFPSKPVRIVVPVATGGTSDVLARQLAVKLQQMWGQGVVVENRAGAASILGTDLVVRSPADGYTLVLQSSAIVIYQALGGKMNFDLDKDLTPIAFLGQTPMIIVANPKSPVNSLSELAAFAKTNQGRLSYASCGIGTPHHLFMELVKQKAGMDITHVAYKGCAPGLQDVLGDQIPIAVASANAVIPYIKSGKLNAVGVSSAQRYSPLPNVRTLEEQGLKPLDLTNWYAMFGPANLPKDVVARLQADITKALNDESVKTGLVNAGIEVYTGSGDEVKKLIASDRNRFEQISRSANIKLE